VFEDAHPLARERGRELHEERAESRSPRSRIVSTKALVGSEEPTRLFSCVISWEFCMADTNELTLTVVAVK
jgi:hypothetical protein